MPIDDFNKYLKSHDESLLDVSLSEEERNSLNTHVRFEIRGKLGRTVSVIIPNDLVNCIKLIIKYRELAGVNKDNIFLDCLEGLQNTKVLAII